MRTYSLRLVAVLLLGLGPAYSLTVFLPEFVDLNKDAARELGINVTFPDPQDEYGEVVKDRMNLIVRLEAPSDLKERVLEDITVHVASDAGDFIFSPQLHSRKKDTNFVRFVIPKAMAKRSTVWVSYSPKQGDSGVDFLLSLMDFHN